MNVDAQSHVVGQVPAIVVRVIIDHNLIAVPEPAIAEAKVSLRNAEVESAEPKTRWTASRQVKDMTPTDTARNSSVLERPVEVVAGIAAARVMSDPFVVGVNVGRFGMPGFIRKTPAFRRGWLFRPARLLLRLARALGASWRRTVRRDMSAAHASHSTAAAPLRTAPSLRGSARGEK